MTLDYGIEDPDYIASEIQIIWRLRSRSWHRRSRLWRRRSRLYGVEDPDYGAEDPDLLILALF
eukprot:12398056-Karenia_brevis.AAC.1